MKPPLGVSTRWSERIHAISERPNVVTHCRVSAVDHHGDGRKDERVFRDRLATGVTNHGFTGAEREVARDGDQGWQVSC